MAFALEARLRVGRTAATVPTPSPPLFLELKQGMSQEQDQTSILTE